MGLIDIYNNSELSDYLAAPQSRTQLFIHARGSDPSLLRPVFGDKDLTQQIANPVVSDESGLFPKIYTFDGEYALTVLDDLGHEIAHDDALIVRSGENPANTKTFSTLALLTNDRLMNYAEDSRFVTVYPGDYVHVISSNLLYRVASEDIAEPHMETLGGIKLTAQPNADGYYPVEAFGFVGDGRPGDRARLQLACDFTEQLLFQSKTYEFNEWINVASDFGSQDKACIIATNSVRWRSLGETTLRISDALQASPNRNDIAILFMQDQEAFSAPGFIFDENASGQGFGGAVCCYGVTLVDVNGVEVRNTGAVRFGASSTRLCGEVRGHIVVSNSVGTFSVGGKPGGARFWRDFSLTVNGGRGGWNAECENVDNRTGLVHATDHAVADTVTLYNIHGDLSTWTSPAEGVVFQDGVRMGSVQRIYGENFTSPSTGRAACVTVKGGQLGPGPEQVSITEIQTKQVEQAVWVEGQSNAIGFVSVGSVQADQTGQLLNSRNTVGAAVQPISSIQIGQVQGSVRSPSNDNQGTAFSVESDNASPGDNAFPPHLKHLRIGGGHLTSVRQRTFSVRGVERLECSGLSVDAHTNAPSGGYAGLIYNVMEADEILITDTVLKGFATNAVPLELRPKVSCRLVGLDLTANGAGTALFLNGSGSVVLEGCRLSGATHAINFRQLQTSFDADTGVSLGQNMLSIPGHGFRHGERVSYAAGTSPIGGLTDQARYYVLYVDANNIRLSETLRGEAVALTDVGTGSASLRKALEVRVNNSRNECTNLVANVTRPLSFVDTGTW